MKQAKLLLVTFLLAMTVFYLSSCDCRDCTEENPIYIVKPPVDQDGDGFCSLLDCDDGNSTINPLAQEIYGNSTDEDCDGYLGYFTDLSTSTESEPFTGYYSLDNGQIYMNTTANLWAFGDPSYRDGDYVLGLATFDISTLDLSKRIDRIQILLFKTNWGSYCPYPQIERAYIYYWFINETEYNQLWQDCLCDENQSCFVKNTTSACSIPLFDFQTAPFVEIINGGGYGGGLSSWIYDSDENFKNIGILAPWEATDPEFLKAIQENATGNFLTIAVSGFCSTPFVSGGDLYSPTNLYFNRDGYHGPRLRIWYQE